MSDLVPWTVPYSGWSILLALAMIGGAIAALGLFADRAKGRRRCPRCAYDLSHSPTPTCSECGHTLRRERDSFRTRRNWQLAAFGVFVAIALPTFVVQRRVRQFGWAYYTYVGPLYWILPDETIERASIGPFELRIVQDRRRWTDGARFIDRAAVVSLGRLRVWSTNAWYLTAGKPGYAGTAPVPVTTDVDGDGVPEFVLEASSGGNDGCSRTFIVKVAGDAALDLNPHTAGPSEDFEELVDLDGDGSRELVGRDHSMAFWHTFHTTSAYGRVVLSIAGGRFRPSIALMRRSPVPDVDSKARARAACHAAGPAAQDELYSPLLTTMLDFIYAGRSGEAYAFLDDAWPGDAASKRQFIAEFQAKLATSPYRDALVALGHPPFDAR